MLKQNSDPVSRRRTAAGEMRHLPIRDESIDVVWCRLAIGHVPDLTSAYGELARVARPGGAVIVTDFHPDATTAGHRRTFRDANGAAHSVEHFVHPVSSHEAVADRLGLTLTQRIDARVGPVVESLYQTAGRSERYAEQRGLPLVLALRFDS
jgi:malonyl-CoA O-methyltransferase